MRVVLNGEAYYRTAEACKVVGISRSTLLRWLNNGIIRDASYRDRRGWRLFTEDEVKQIVDEANKIQKAGLFKVGKP